jgi:threonine aldolase
MAKRLPDAMPFRVTHPVQANGVFVEMDEEAHERLHQAGWSTYRFIDGSVRFMCSWATRPETVDEMVATLRALA